MGFELRSGAKKRVVEKSNIITRSLLLTCLSSWSSRINLRPNSSPSVWFILFPQPMCSTMTFDKFSLSLIPFPTSFSPRFVSAVRWKAGREGLNLGSPIYLTIFLYHITTIFWDSSYSYLYGTCNMDLAGWLQSLTGKCMVKETSMWWVVRKFSFLFLLSFSCPP